MLISQEQVLDVLETAVISKFGQSNHLHSPTRWTAWKRLRPSELNLPSFQGPTPKRPFASLAERAAASGDARRVIEYLSAAAERCEFRQEQYRTRHHRGRCSCDERHRGVGYDGATRGG